MKPVSIPGVNTDSDTLEMCCVGDTLYLQVWHDLFLKNGSHCIYLYIKLDV